MATKKVKKLSKLDQFISEVTFKEGKKISVSRGNVKEVLSIVNKKTRGILYAVIKALPMVFFCFFLSGYSFSQIIVPRTYWHFDGVNTATAVDDSMNVFNLAHSGTLGIVTGGDVGKFGRLSSSTGIITAANDFTAYKDSFAIEFLWKPGYDFNTCRFFLLQNNSVTIEFTWPVGYVRPFFKFYTSKSNGQVDDFQVVLDGINTRNLGYFMDGNWHHMVFQYNCMTGTKQIWVDGTLPSGYSKVTATGGSILTPNVPLYMNHTINYVRYYGDMDEIATYTRPLTQALIQKHYENFQAGQHYAFTGTPTSVPTTLPVAGSNDIMDYPVGHTTSTVTWTVPPGMRGPDGEPQGTFVTKQWSTGAVRTAYQQLQRYPSPRFKTGHTLLPNINVCGLNYAAGNGQTVPPVTTPALYTQITSTAKRTMMHDMSVLLCQKYNMTVHFDNINNSGSSFSNTATDYGMLAKLANDSLNFKVSAGMFRAQISPAVTNQSQPNANYMQNSSGQFINQAGNVITSGKIIRITNDPAIYNSDGLSMKNTLQLMINALPSRPASRKVDHLWENGEWFPLLSQTAVNADPVLNAARIASGLDWYTFASRGYARHAKESWRDQFMNLSGLAQTRYMEYTLTGHNTFMYKWRETRIVNTPQVEGDNLSTPDYYFRKSDNWRFWAGSDHGIQWGCVTRAEEIGATDEFNAPFVSAGWYIDETKNMRPGQYLGAMKILVGMGAKFFHNAYFGNLNNPFGLPQNWIWQMVLPNYAQGCMSWIENDFRNSTVMPGDYPQDYVAGSDSSFLFKTGDLRKLVTVRKVTGQPKYIIFGTIQPNSIMDDDYSKTEDALITIPGVGAMTIEVRRQGSVYFLDRSNPTDVKFYQLDSWHERFHPDWWSNDMVYQAELYNTTNGILKTEGISGTDYTDAVSYLQFGTGDTASYTVQRNDLSSDTRYVWIRARSVTGGEVSLDMSLDGDLKDITCISDPAWRWYRYSVNGADNVSYSSMTAGRYVFNLQATGLVEVDQFAFTESSSDVFGETVPSCAGSPTASIDPAGPVEVCPVDLPVTLTASIGASYLWSTGETTQVINVTGTDTYTVTISYVGFGDETADVSVTVFNAPSLDPIGNVYNACPEDSVEIADIVIVNNGEPGTEVWYPTLADALAETNDYASTDSVSAGWYYVRVTTGDACFVIDSAQVIINNCGCASTPTVYAGPDITVCVNDLDIKLNGQWNSQGNIATWSSAGGGVFSTSNTDLTGRYFFSATDYSNGFVDIVLTSLDSDAGGPCVTVRDTMRVTILPLPSATITSSGPTDICQGSSIMLSAPSGLTQQWSTGALTQSILVDSAATYTLVTQGANGCQNTSDVTVTVKSLPTPVITASGSIYCDQGSVTLTSSTFLAYQWNTGASTKTIMVSDTGSYTVTVLGSNGCYGSQTIAVTDTCTIAVCSAPYNLNATNVTWWSARVTFNTVVPDIGIQLVLKNTFTGKITTADYNKNTTSVWLWGLRSRTTYEYYLVAKCVSGNYTSVKKTFKTR